ncbi:hypothetical protein K7432_014448 [Basidiobolus ranarum]|uniref:Uncharacterized protein n=1 Tax=Basidiobolus ranarum TaxID=34480 RepID=A0ABR2WHL2_9FUNG
MVFVKPDPNGHITDDARQDRSKQSRKCAIIVIFLIFILLLAAVSRALWWATTRRYVMRTSHERVKGFVPPTNYHNKGRKPEQTNTIILVPVDYNSTNPTLPFKLDGTLNEASFRPLATISPHQKVTTILPSPKITNKKGVSGQGQAPMVHTNSTQNISVEKVTSANSTLQPTHTSTIQNSANSTPIITLPKH